MELNRIEGIFERYLMRNEKVIGVDNNRQILLKIEFLEIEQTNEIGSSF